MNDATHAHEMDRYWNEEGGERWVRYLDRLEGMLSELAGTLVAAVDPQPGGRVLDIGCGGGPTSAVYAERVQPDGIVLGVDISETILTVARTRFGHLANLRFDTADAGTCDFEAGSFDVITSRFGVMFFPEPVAAFSNIRRAGRDGARLCFLCWRRPDENPWMTAAAQAAFRYVTPPEKPQPGDPGPFSLGDPELLLATLTQAGFRDISNEPIDTTIHLGPVDEALDWLTNMGPAAAPLKDAADGPRSEAIGAMRAVLTANATGGDVQMPGAVWLVRAAC